MTAPTVTRAADDRPYRCVIARPVRRLVVAIRISRPPFPLFSNGNLKTPQFSLFNLNFLLPRGGERGRQSAVLTAGGWRAADDRPYGGI